MISCILWPTPSKETLILVRTGREKGKAKGSAIGIVYKNEYVQNAVEWQRELRIHVLWINKSGQDQLAENTTIPGWFYPCQYKFKHI